MNKKTNHLQQVIRYREQLSENPELCSLFLKMTLNCNEYCRHCGSNSGDQKLEKGLFDYEILQCLILLRNDLSEAKQSLPFEHVHYKQLENRNKNPLAVLLKFNNSI